MSRNLSNKMDLNPVQYICTCHAPMFHFPSFKNNFLNDRSRNSALSRQDDLVWIVAEYATQDSCAPEEFRIGQNMMRYYHCIYIIVKIIICFILRAFIWSFVNMLCVYVIDSSDMLITIMGFCHVDFVLSGVFMATLIESSLLFEVNILFWWIFSILYALPCYPGIVYLLISQWALAITLLFLASTVRMTPNLWRYCSSFAEGIQTKLFTEKNRRIAESQKVKMGLQFHDKKFATISELLRRDAKKVSSFVDKAYVLFLWASSHNEKDTFLFTNVTSFLSKAFSDPIDSCKEG